MGEPLHALALAGTACAAVACVLLGVWLGFRICTRDAALLARFAVDAREARAVAERTAAAQKALAEEVDATLESVERKRASAAASATRAERAKEAPPPEAAAAAQIEQLTGRARRRAISRALRNGGMPQ